MIVVTLLVSDRQFERVKAATPAPQWILRASSVAQTFAFLREQPVDLLVVDPIAGDVIPRVAVSATELLSIGVEFPYLPVVFYVSDANKALHLITHFPTRERCEAVIAGIDDDQRSIAHAVEAVVGQSLAARLLHCLGPTTADTPPSLLRTMRHVFSNPRLFSTVDDVAAAARMSRRTLDRWLARSGIVSGVELLQLAKALLAVRLRRDLSVGRDGIYAMCGLGGSAKVDALVERTMGSSHDQLTALSDADLTTIVGQRLRRGCFSEQAGAISGCSAARIARGLGR